MRLFFVWEILGLKYPASRDPFWSGTALSIYEVFRVFVSVSFTDGDGETRGTPQSTSFIFKVYYTYSQGGCTFLLLFHFTYL